MKTKTIDLRNYPTPESAEKTEPGKDDTGNYPELSITDHEDPSILDMPDEGTATIHHQVVHRSESTIDGKKRHSVRLRVKSIQPHGKRPAKALPSAKDDEAAVDKGL